MQGLCSNSRQDTTVAGCPIALSLHKTSGGMHASN